MPIRDTAVMDDFLDLTLESATWELALFDGDPMTDDGVELSGNGYARATIAPGDWLPASGGEKSTTAPVAFAAPTGEWAEASHTALIRTTDGAMGDTQPVAEDAEWPTAASDEGPSVSVTVFYDEAVESDAF